MGLGLVMQVQDTAGLPHSMSVSRISKGIGMCKTFNVFVFSILKRGGASGGGGGVSDELHRLMKLCLSKLEI